MTGFDNYIPSKWLDGVLAIHVSAPKAQAMRVFRGGKWAAKATISAAFFAGAVVSAAEAPLPAQTIEVVRGASDGAEARDGLHAPAGYFRKLETAISQTTPLAEQSTANDPVFSF